MNIGTLKSQTAIYKTVKGLISTIDEEFLVFIKNEINTIE